MNIKLELLKNQLSDVLFRNIEVLDIDINQIVQSTAISMLEKIQNIIKDESLSDFEVIDNIICVFEEYGINCGSRYDF